MSTKIKVCGLTNVADALDAARLGVEALGLNFYPPSPRFVSEDVAAQIVRELPPFVEPVGLFVNEPLDRIQATMIRLGLRTFQVHGDRREPCALSLRMIAAFAIVDRGSLAIIKRFVEECREQDCLPAAILVDAHVPGLHGGTGKVAPWDLLAELQLDVPIILAGGLTPDNVADAVRQVRPYAVDVASGVESSPGKKDLDKMKRFVDHVRNA